MTKDVRSLTGLFETASLGAPEKAVGFVLWRLVHRYQRESDRALAPVGLTHLQFMALAMAAWLGRSGDAVSQTGLSRSAAIHPMQVSLMLKTLEAKGLIRRPRDTANVRAKMVEVTAEGAKALRAAMPLMIEVQRRLFGDEGRPGGALLAALVKLDPIHSD